jgi:pyrroline-5-carboxylate reductase
MANQVAVVGAGVMGEAFIAALIRSGVPATSIIAVVRRSERGDELVAKYGISVKPLDEALRTSDVVMLGIKPQGLADLMPEIAPHLRPDCWNFSWPQ